ncbi:MAG TPA: hypothetical protein VFE16_08475 [Candidatus Cybelea sp.]|nr:hypothetical protein [Candidatus Cybelea sp.]
MNDKRFRFDLLIAVSALLVSTVAAAASAYQTYVIRSQFSATVWPYLDFITTTSPESFEFDVSNPGIGPALIMSSVVSRDGKPLVLPATPTTHPALELAILPEMREARTDALASHTHGVTSMSASTIIAGDVVPAGAKLTLLRVSGKFITRHIVADIKHVDLTLCYCSLLGDCWTKRLWDPQVAPHRVRSCPNA